MEEQKVTINEEMPIKKRQIKWNRVLILLLLIIIVIAFVPFGSSSLGKKFLSSITASAIGSDIVAIVDKEKITKEQLEKEYNGLSPDFRNVFTKETLLRQLIADKLILGEAKNENIEVSDEEFSQILDQAVLGLPQGITLEQLAENQGFSLDEFKVKIMEQLIVKRYLDKNVVVKNVDLDEANAFFDANKEKLKKPEMVNASHILVKTKPEADEIVTQLKDGASFEELAKEKSLDPGTKINGGNLGYFGRGQMVKEFENTAFNLNVGDVSAPVQTEFGFHVIKVYDRKPETEANFDDLKGQIIKYLQDQENQRAIQSHVNKLVDDGISSGKIKILYKENS